MKLRHLYSDQSKMNIAWVLVLLLVAACKNESQLTIQRSASTFTFDMTSVGQPFDKACFVRSEYNQFYFGSQIALLSKRAFVPAVPNTINITPSNISKRGYKYLEKGYSKQYLLLVLKNGSSYQAFPIYGPKVDGVPSLRYNSGSFARISTPLYSAPRACTTNKDAIAQCSEIGGRCMMLFDTPETKSDEF